MTIVVRCPECGTSLKFRDDALGKRGKCTTCQSVVQIAPDGEQRRRDQNDDADFTAKLATQAGTARSRNEGGLPRSNRQPETAATTEPARSDEPRRITLLTARPRIRVIVLIVLLIPVLLASRVSLTTRLLSCFIPLMLTGTYRTSRIRGDRFTTKFHVGFFPVAKHRCDLRGVSYLNVRYGREGSGWGTFLLFGPFQVVLGRVFDFLIPSIGGPYQIHLCTAKGRELVAWQGFAEAEFRSTLILLTSLTNAELRSM